MIREMKITDYRRLGRFGIVSSAWECERWTIHLMGLPSFLPGIRPHVSLRKKKEK